MQGKKASEKVECLNPNTGGRMQIDKGTYDLFFKAISHTLKKKPALTYTQMVEGIEAYLEQKKAKFDGSVSWYAVTVKNDMQVKGLISIVTEKGRKLHSLNI